MSSQRPAPPDHVCACRYGDGTVRLTVEENVVLPNIPADRLEALQAEPLFQRFPIHGGEKHARELARNQWREVASTGHRAGRAGSS